MFSSGYSRRLISDILQGQSSLADHIRKSYSTNDLRVPDDSMDGDDNIRFIDDEDELGKKFIYFQSLSHSC